MANDLKSKRDQFMKSIIEQQLAVVDEIEELKISE